MEFFVGALVVAALVWLFLRPRTPTLRIETGTTHDSSRARPAHALQTILPHPAPWTEARTTYRELPSTPRVVPSDSEDAEYRLNLVALACTCPDFTKRRGHRQQDDPRRLCKHLRREIVACARDLSPAWKAFLLDEYAGSADHVVQAAVDESPVIAYWRDDAPWTNVIARERNRKATFSRFGYSIEEQRWSYSESPHAASKLRQLLEALRR